MVTKRLRYAGFAQEAEYGTFEAAATFHVDIASASLDTPSDAEILYSGGRGRSPAIRRPGFYSPEGDVVYAVDVETIAAILKWALGGYEFTAAEGEGTINTHEVWGYDQQTLDSFTAFVGKDALEHVFAGCTLNSLELSVEGEFVQATLGIVGAEDKKVTLSAEGDLLLPDDYPMTFQHVKVENGASNISADVKSLTLSITNNADASAGRGMGQRTPYRVPVNAREVTMSMSLWFDDTTYLESFWGGASAPDHADGSDAEAFTVTLDVGDGRSVELELPNAYINEINLTASGRDELVQDVNVTAMRDVVTLLDASTVDTEIVATILNNGGDLT